MKESYWKSKFNSFEVITNWERYINSNKTKHKLNEYRLVKINTKLYLEVKTQKPDITFLTDLKNFKSLKEYTWRSLKPTRTNTNYIATYYTNNSKITTLYFHCLITNFKIVDHISRNGLDNREVNLRDGLKSINQLNCKLFKTNTSGYNGISFRKKSKIWSFTWFENKKPK
ncbi:16271_t:CDS:1, partial [Dentiscutata heterogama]